MQVQQQVVLESLLPFYNLQINRDIIKELINGIYINEKGNIISLRLLEWFVTNYSKKNLTEYPIIRRNKPFRFQVYTEYVYELGGYHKKKFDMFGRNNHITFIVNDDTQEKVDTTVAQLKFFKWAIENEVLTYLKSHYDEIYSDMKLNGSSSKKRLQNSSQSSTSSTDSNMSSISSDSIDSINKIEPTNKTRKKRQELSVSALRGFKKENVLTIVSFCL